MPTVFSATVTDSLDDMAQQLGLPKDQFLATVKEFNESCQDGEFYPTELDGSRTSGTTPEKNQLGKTNRYPTFFWI